MITTTITPHRGRLSLLRNHLISLNYQTDPPEEIMVVSQGDTADDQAAIHRLVDEVFHNPVMNSRVRVLCIGTPEDPWHKALAINYGIRRCHPKTQIIATLDVDCILSPEHMTVLRARLKSSSSLYVLCPNRSLIKGAVKPGWTYEQLADAGQWLDWKGQRESMGPISFSPGCCQAAVSEWWFDVRGVDEDFLWWGSEDEDLAQRASLSGLRWSWMPQKYKMVHQYHPAGQRTPAMKQYVDRNAKISRKRLGQKLFRRNLEHWGGGAPSIRHPLDP